jgi:hypothetical protein
MRLGSTPGSLKFFLLELHFCMGNLHGAVLDGVARGRALWPR